MDSEKRKELVDQVRDGLCIGSACPSLYYSDSYWAMMARWTYTIQREELPMAYRCS